MKVDKVEYGGLVFNYRHDTTDWNIIREACGGLNTKYFDVEEGEMWFDIGAHIGAFTCYAAFKGGYIIAYEPVPNNQKLLYANILENSLEQRAEAHYFAITKDGRDIQIFIDEQNFGNCSKYDRGNEKFITVMSKPASMLDKFSNTLGYCIKIDTEGCEYEILSSIDLSKVNKLIMEDHYWLIGEEEHAALTLLILENFPNVRRHEDYMVYAWR